MFDTHSLLCVHPSQTRAPISSRASGGWMRGLRRPMWDLNARERKPKSTSSPAYQPVLANHAGMASVSDVDSCESGDDVHVEE